MQTADVDLLDVDPFEVLPEEVPFEEDDDA